MTDPRDSTMRPGRAGRSTAATALTVVAALAAAAALGPAVLAAQQPSDTVRLAPIVVTATRLPTPLGSVASAITVVTGDELRERGVATVADALRAVPGVDVVETGPFGSATSLFLRGGESDYVRVLVDGVPLNAPGGGVDLSTLATADVERIEIVRGPASVLYGSDAVTGVVQVFTRSGHGPLRWDAGASGGTFGARSWDARVGGGGGRAAFSGGWSHFADAGVYAFNNQYRDDVLGGSLTLLPDGRTSARLVARYTDDLYHYPTDGSGNVVYHNQYQTGGSLVASLDAGRFLTPRLEARVLLGGTESSGRVDQQPNTPADTLGYYAFTSFDRLSRRSADARLNLHAAEGTVLTAGAVLETEAERSSSLSLSQYGPSPGSLVVSRWNRAFYVQALAEPARALSLVAGARVERNEAFGSFLTWRAGAAWQLASTRLHATAGTAFKEPSFFENYATGYVTGNPALAPERAASWDAGIEQRLLDGRLVVGATWFSQRFRNLIQFTFAPPTPTSPNYYNVAAADASGLELEARVTPNAAVSIAAQYTYTHTAAADSGFDGAAFAQGGRLLRRPTHAASLVAAARWSAAAGASLAAYWVGDREDEDFSGATPARVTLPPYLRLDLAGDVALLRARGAAPGVTATLKVENLLDRRYEQVLNFPSRRRAVFAGVRIGTGR
jgi:vitamin B12 transporter